ncbi:MAG: toprim domain-containing protein [Candidatus Woesearchaeota archaeon]
MELIDEINKLKISNKLIIVEGKKDIIALNKFGIKNIIEIKGPLEIFSEHIANKFKEVIILTDLDIEGKKLYSKLNKYLSHQGVIIDNNFRNYLYKKTKLTQIEGLTKYVKTQEDLHKNRKKMIFF